jgi:hypothetical protein
MIFIPVIKNIQMKNLKPRNKKENITFNANKHRPENKDNLDSREGLEQDYKGDDITHNRKETKSDRKSKGK